ncbi:hypothetical protein ACJX0J_040137, partial [Zea mays]
TMAYGQKGGPNYIERYSIEYLVFWQEKTGPILFGTLFLMSIVWHKLVGPKKSSKPKTPNLAVMRQVIIYHHLDGLNELEESSKFLHYFPQLCLFAMMHSDMHMYCDEKMKINKHLVTN